MFDPIRFVQQSRRVLSVSRRPTMKEINHLARVCAIGIVAVGALGVFISFVFSFT